MIMKIICTPCTLATLAPLEPFELFEQFDRRERIFELSEQFLSLENKKDKETTFLINVLRKEFCGKCNFVLFY